MTPDRARRHNFQKGWLNLHLPKGGDPRLELLLRKGSKFYPCAETIRMRFIMKPSSDKGVLIETSSSVCVSCIRTMAPCIMCHGEWRAIYSDVYVPYRAHPP